MIALRRRTPFEVVAAVLAVALVVAVGVLVVSRFALVLPRPPAVAAPVDPASGDVSVFPPPGAPSASPQTQLTFRGVSGQELGPVDVEGALSGHHTVSLLAHSDGQGVSVVPDEPFTPGEEVSVSTDLAVRGGTGPAGQAGRAGRGGPGGGDWSFTVSVPAQGPRLAVPPVRQQDADAPVERFASAPQLHPPSVQVLSGSPGALATTDPGVVALGVKNGYGQKGPLLLDTAGDPVWFDPLEGLDARAVGVQTYRGQPVLTWWEGRAAETGYGAGEDVLVDETYHEVARVRAGNGYAADFHELYLTPEGTALVTAYPQVRMDLSGVGGPSDGVVVDGVVQEVDVETGAVLLEWHSLGSLDLSESYDDPGADAGYDYVHPNSVAVDAGGDLVVSARNTCAVYGVDRTTGSTTWRLGGRRSDYALPEGARFLRQHDVRPQQDGTLTLFDNGGTCGDHERESSRGLALALDEATMTARVVRAVPHPDGLFSETQGTYQELASGDAFLGWGSLPRWSVLGPDGGLLLDEAFPHELVVTSYRAQLTAWEGRPTTDPSAVAAADGSDEVLVSWNGATEVASWSVVDASTGEELGSAVRDGFETAVAAGGPGAAPAGPVRVVVVARDSSGAALGASAPVDLPARAAAG